MEAVHCRAQVSVSRGPPLGLGCHPCPRRISRSPRRGRLTAPRIAYAMTPVATHVRPGRGLTRRADPTIGRASTSGCVQNPVWACPGRRFVPVPRMSDIYISQQGLSRHKQPDELNAIAISCGELVALSVLCVQRPGERRGSQSCLGIFVPPSLPGVRFVPRFGWGSYGASQNQKLT